MTRKNPGDSTFDYDPAAVYGNEPVAEPVITEEVTNEAPVEPEAPAE